MRLAWVWIAALALGSLACSSSDAPQAKAPQVEGDELAALLADEDIFLLDVRDPSELEELGTVEGYVNIPIDQLEDRLDEIPKDKRILTA